MHAGEMHGRAGCVLAWRRPARLAPAGTCASWAALALCGEVRDRRPSNLGHNAASAADARLLRRIRWSWPGPIAETAKATAEVGKADHGVAATPAVAAAPAVARPGGGYAHRRRRCPLAVACHWLDRSRKMWPAPLVLPWRPTMPMARLGVRGTTASNDDEFEALWEEQQGDLVSRFKGTWVSVTES
jgi:hypothetical protein